jgi:hypothetical protein
MEAVKKDKTKFDEFIGNPPAFSGRQKWSYATRAN